MESIRRVGIVVTGVCCGDGGLCTSRKLLGCCAIANVSNNSIDIFYIASTVSIR